MAPHCTECEWQEAQCQTEANAYPTGFGRQFEVHLLLQIWTVENIINNIWWQMEIQPQSVMV